MGTPKLIYVALAFVAPGLAEAQTTDAPGATTVQAVVVVADKAGLLSRKAGNVVLGIDKPLSETPRSATTISDTTLQRYGAQTVNDLVALSPGAFTASYYGVAGALNLRGTLAETYFRGFKLIEDRGTYTTPIGDAAQIDIVRGPPSPIYGAGKVGGFLNITPKTAADQAGSLDQPTGEVSATLGSYQLKDFTAQVAAPLKLGTLDGGVYGYGDYYDAHSYYRGIYPSHQNVELAANLNLPDGWRFEVGGMYLHEEGNIQTPGWNRLTQDLIDNGTYITGHNTTLVDSNHDGRLEPGEVGPGPASSYPFGTSILQFVGGAAKPTADPRFVLDTGLGTTQLSPRDVFVSSADFSHTDTHVYYADLDKTFSKDSDLKFQLFYNDLDNKRFVSYGFPAWYRTYVAEARVPYHFKLSTADGGLSADTVLGVDYRYTQAHRMESFDSGLIAVDRRDLSVGATPTDIFDSPFDNSPGGIGWEIDNRTRERDAGGFVTTDIAVAHRLDLILGGRYDFFNVEGRDTGIFSFEPAGTLRAGQGKGTWSASVTYKLPLGLIPYVTYSEDAALEVNQASDIPTSAIASGGWLSKSDLREAGVKFSELKGALVGSVDVYRQTRSQFAGLNSAVQGTVGKGVESEVRWLATSNLSFTFAGDIQHTEVKGPDGSQVLIPPSAVGVPDIDGFGGSYFATISSLPGRAGNYAYTLIPHGTFSLYANYITDPAEWGRAGATIGATHQSQTSGVIEGAVVYPAYFVANGSMFYRKGPWETDLNVDNLFDKTYFTPDADILSEVAALPSVGRTWRLTVKRSF
ncbi:TonB-dependent siderophore receptor [Caulobacter sp. S45]|uniref:TonB-dependent siderophore receptor n=1 Tax=Caulobacter sp. S45 TaxID=1641861 RepID=UPI0020B1455D|nr:TonB-dependent receptor [Caulobacter sp. S45]